MCKYLRKCKRLCSSSEYNSEEAIAESQQIRINLIMSKVYWCDKNIIQHIGI